MQPCGLHRFNAGGSRVARCDLDRGDSNQLILQNFVQKYGPTVLAAPPQHGFDLMAWIAPGLFLLLATLGTALLIRKWKLHTVAMPERTANDPHGCDPG